MVARVSRVAAPDNLPTEFCLIAVSPVLVLDCSCRITRLPLGPIYSVTMRHAAAAGNVAVRTLFRDQKRGEARPNGARGLGAFTHPWRLISRDRLYSVRKKVIKSSLASGLSSR